jgi:hypothetical protein
MPWSRSSGHALAGLLALSACGGKVVVELDAEADVGSSTAAAPNTTSAGSATSASSGGVGGGAPSCGGKQGGECAVDQWCRYEPPSDCGGGDETGVCEPRPQGCPADCPGVCGCDGLFYCNECEAHAAGFDTTGEMQCGVEGDYSALNLFTGAPRAALLKADPVRDLCFRIVTIAVAGATLELTLAPGSSIESAEVTDHASDCAPWGGGFPPPPLGSSFAATGAAGTLSLGAACDVEVHGNLFFEGAPAWVPVDEQLEAVGVPIEGGCP